MRYYLAILVVYYCRSVEAQDNYAGASDRETNEQLPADLRRCHKNSCFGDEVCVLRNPNRNPRPTCVVGKPGGRRCSDIQCDEGELCEYIDRKCSSYPCYPVPVCQGPQRRFSVDPRKPSRIVKEQSLRRVLRQNMFDCEMSGNCGSGSIEELDHKPTPVQEKRKSCSETDLVCGPNNTCMDTESGATCAPNEESVKIMKSPSSINWCSMMRCSGQCTNTKNGPVCDTSKSKADTSEEQEEDTTE